MKVFAAGCNASLRRNPSLEKREKDIIVFTSTRYYIFKGEDIIIIFYVDKILYFLVRGQDIWNKFWPNIIFNLQSMNVSL